MSELRSKRNNDRVIIRASQEPELSRSGGEEHEQDGSYRIIYTDQLPELPPLHFGEICSNGKLTIRSSLKELVTYKNYLSQQQNLQQAKNYPQIGNFLDLADKCKFKGAMFHQLFVRICEHRVSDKKTNKNIFERWFVVNGKPLRLSAHEFALVSGLKFDYMLKTSDIHMIKASDLKARYFPRAGSNKVSVNSVKIKLDEMVIDHVDNIDRLKLVYVLIVSTFLLSSRNETIKDYVFDVCDNLDLCEKYAWGRKCWNATLDEVLQNAGDLTTYREERKWNAYGCPWIVIFWAYEAIEGLAELCHSMPRPDFDEEYPRMLRWIVGSNSPNNTQVRKFLDQASAVIPILHPTEEEKQKSYFSHLEEWMTSFNNQFDVFRSLVEDLGDDYVIVRERPAPGGVEGEEENDASRTSPNQSDISPSLHRPNVRRTSQRPSTSNIEDTPHWATQLMQMCNDNQRWLMQIDERQVQIDQRQIQIEQMVKEVHESMVGYRTQAGGREREDEVND